MSQVDIPVFRLKDGKLIVHDDRIVIVDRSLIKRKRELWGNGLMLPALLYVMYRLYESQNYAVVAAAFFIVDCIYQQIKTVFRTSQRVVMFSDIRSVKERRKFFVYYIDIRLDNNRVRRVVPYCNSKEIVQKISAFI